MQAARTAGKSVFVALRDSVLAAALIAASLSPPAVAQDARNQGYLVDAHGQNAIVRAIGAGVCVRTSDWSPARAVAECDPDIVKKPEPRAAKPKAAEKPKPKSSARLAPTALVPQKISLTADALFDFDKAVLKPAGKAKLDDVARLLREARYDVVLATGHTDRIGSAAYNRKLSLRRADAVRTYLVEKGVPANRVSVDGKGESQPVTRPGDCRGTRGKALIACLQPDRRVDVEVTGTKDVK